MKRYGRGIIVWRGPLPFDLGRCERGALMEFVSQFSEVTDIYVDALKDVAVKLTDDEVGSRVNAEIQEVIANDVEVVTDHHQRKASADNKKPRRLDDVYGSVVAHLGLRLGAAAVGRSWRSDHRTLAPEAAGQ